MKQDRTYFWRKVHSLSGLIPIGVFLIIHLSVNFTAILGEEAYNEAAAFMGSLPFNTILAIFVIYIPILFHGIYGIFISREAKNNISSYRYERNWYFYLQRLSGIIALLFIIWHVATTRVPATFGAEVNFDMIANLVKNPIYLVFFIVGTLMTIFHFANGVRTMLITWGITVSEKSQRLGKFIAVTLFILLSAIGIVAIFAFV
ncbi:succinate dehydrogenase / fumarate reductase cytochrome b subunit [Texcoconibacillus texcoconensis]|uniref:Succinate dehydrogenase / fumarate reductase cytochrome b subunit n=1 Tax=Texcoconibacillus texcoconensis TaxID=1095777 RepID=A0A840QM49_9BACI|nr:succinate dehydrogenase / fumarate reductase cytochrome b subunit [Texcoconibacillus texcoconensis]